MGTPSGPDGRQRNGPRSQITGCSSVKDLGTEHEPDHTHVLPEAQETVVWQLGGGAVKDSGRAFDQRTCSGSGMETGGAWSCGASVRLGRDRRCMELP